MRPRKLLVTGLGAGSLPIAPGTWASAAMAAAWLLAAFLLRPHGQAGVVAVQALLLASVAGWSAVTVLLGHYAEEAFGKKDPGAVTADEWAGQALAFVALPMLTGGVNLLVVAGVAFAAFRVFDILKPPPAWQAQRLPHGWGILVDDLVAGVYANLLCQLVLRVLLGL